MDDTQIDPPGATRRVHRKPKCVTLAVRTIAAERLEQAAASTDRCSDAGGTAVQARPLVADACGVAT